jgi:hypothetical protein
MRPVFVGIRLSVAVCQRNATAMSNFRKTRIMNIVGASGFAVMGVALFLNKMREQSIVILAVIVAMYAAMTLIPALTARALSRGGSPTLQRAMLRANWMLIGFWGLCLVLSLVLMTVEGFSGATILRILGGLVGSALLYVLPEWVNIRSLRAALTSENSSVAQKVESAN